jgi:hypothetical protein
MGQPERYIDTTGRFKGRLYKITHANYNNALSKHFIGTGKNSVPYESISLLTMAQRRGYIKSDGA